MKKVIFTLWVVSLLCGGCASTQGKPRLVVLQNPETAEFVDCKVSDGWDDSAAFAKNDECVAESKKKGFVVWAER
jgi:hypothetical protein